MTLTSLTDPVDHARRWFGPVGGGSMTPVLGWCERCGGGFPLYAVVQQGTGACPHCRQPLACDPTAALVESAAVVDAAYGRLVTAVQQLERLAGHLRINTDQLLRTLAEQIAAPTV